MNVNKSSFRHAERVIEQERLRERENESGSGRGISKKKQKENGVVLLSEATTKSSGPKNN
jgi:hypothetical protein